MAKGNDKSGVQYLELNFSDTKNMVKHCIVNQLPIMIHGQPGIGKSDMIHEIGRELGRKVIDIRLALYESPDIKGYPFIGKDANGVEKLKFAYSEEFPDDPEEDAIIFFDEINAALPTTLLAMYQLILNRRVGNYVLPKKVSMVAAGNRQQDKGGTFTMPLALENRFAHVEMFSNPDKWIEYAITNNVHPDIIGFIKKDEAKLNTYDPQKCSRAFATPRTWMMVNKFLNLETPISEDQIKHLAAGFVGPGVAAEFMAFRKIAAELPDPMDILSGKLKKLDKKYSMDVGYTIVTNALYRLRRLHQEDIKEGRIDENGRGNKRATKEWSECAENFFKFLLENEEAIGPEFAVLSVSTGYTTYKLPFNSDVPTMREVAKRYKDLILDD